MRVLERPKTEYTQVTEGPRLPVDRYAAVGLEDLGSASLMRRQDTKYVFGTDLLGDLLRGLEEEYAVLEVDGRRQHGYLTLYFDTPELDLFQSHHRGMGRRVKVRERQYQTTGQLFLEVKQRSNKGVTSKARTEAPDWLHVLEPASMPSDLLDLAGSGGSEAARLVPALWNSYERITLVRRGQLERVTIDTGLTYTTSGRRQHSADGVAIVEVKQPRIDRNSPFMQRLRELGVRPSGFSKYCIGMSLLRPEVRHNRFRPKLRALKGLMEGAQVHA